MDSIVSSEPDSSPIAVICTAIGGKTPEFCIDCAAYAIADTTERRVDLFRLDYPIEKTQAKVMKAGLPEVLAQRLAIGR